MHECVPCMSVHIYQCERDETERMVEVSTSDALRNATSGSSVPACIESRSSLQHNKFIPGFRL